MSFKKPINPQDRSMLAKSAKSAKPNREKLKSAGIRRVNSTRMISSAVTNRSSSKPDFRQALQTNVYREAYVALDILREGDTYVNF